MDQQSLSHDHRLYLLGVRLSKYRISINAFLNLIDLLNSALSLTVLDFDSYVTTVLLSALPLTLLYTTSMSFIYSRQGFFTVVILVGIRIIMSFEQLGLTPYHLLWNHRASHFFLLFD